MLPFSWHGMTWFFQSVVNLDLFAASPEVWKIVDGKLYLNCSPSAHEKWSRDISGHIKMADENWRKMQGEK